MKLRIICLLVFVLILAGSAAAQNTTITGTITDPNGNPYASGSSSGRIVCPGNAQPYIGNSPLNRTVSVPSLDGNGFFSTSVKDVNFITTGPGTSAGTCAYQFTFTESCGIASFTTGTLGGVSQSPVITGAGPVDLSAVIHPFAVPLSAGCVPPISLSGNNTFTGANKFTGQLFANPIISTSANPAQTGVLRLASLDQIGWRNVANTNDITIAHQLGAGNLPPDILFLGLGAQSTFFTTQGTTQALTGQFRLQNTDAINWRNVGNTADIGIVDHGAASGTVPADVISLAGGAGGFAANPILITFTNPASSGDIRLGNTGGIEWRNNANNNDIGLSKNSSDVFILGGGSGGGFAPVTTNAMFIPGTPTISAGFNAGSIPANNQGLNRFGVIIGTGTASSTGTITFPVAAAHFWACFAQNEGRPSIITNNSGTPTTAGFTNYSGAGIASATPTNWVNGDGIDFWCTAQ